MSLKYNIPIFSLFVMIVARAKTEEQQQLPSLHGSEPIFAIVNSGGLQVACNFEHTVRDLEEN
jgi:hypothetical protein